MPLMAGEEATRQIKLQLPNVRIVALSMFEEADMAEAMRQAGAEAYLLKTAPSLQTFRTLHTLLTLPTLNTTTAPSL